MKKYAGLAAVALAVYAFPAFAQRHDGGGDSNGSQVSGGSLHDGGHMFGGGFIPSCGPPGKSSGVGAGNPSETPAPMMVEAFPDSKMAT